MVLDSDDCFVKMSSDTGHACKTYHRSQPESAEEVTTLNFTINTSRPSGYYVYHKVLTLKDPINSEYFHIQH
jgi:hypothetical protein